MNLASILESLLFASGEPVSVRALARAVQKSDAETREALAAVAANCRERGVVLLQNGDECQLGTHPDNAPFVETFREHEFAESLSKPALETLAIIAYQGPLAKSDIDYARGVNSSSILQTLLLRGLVERTEHPKDARASVWRVSFDFLKHLGLRSPEELPHYGEFRKKEEPGVLI